MIPEYNVLVIGCGNIGAQYDLESSEVKTHVKAWSLMPNVNLSIFDLDKELLEKISHRYNCQISKSVSVESLAKFDCVCICTPTQTHKDLILATFEAKVKVIICEKPVTDDLDYAREILEAYTNSSSVVLVNYIRRFQPAYFQLQNYLSSLLKTGETLIAVNIKYNRGFINNCSHAFDLLEYLFKKELVIDYLYKFNPVFDHFSSDPTVSLSGNWGDASISVLGLPEVLYSIFEIEIYFKTHKVLIVNAGDHIEFYQKIGTSGPLIKTEEISGCITNYMKFVIEEASGILASNGKGDNFISSIKLNTRMLNYLRD